MSWLYQLTAPVNISCMMGFIAIKGIYLMNNNKNNSIYKHIECWMVRVRVHSILGVS